MGVYRMYYELSVVRNDSIARVSERRLVEHDGRQLGMIVEKPHGYVVYACTPLIWPLDRRVFSTWEAAEREMVVSAAL